jgi:hypothetical protein
MEQSIGHRAWGAEHGGERIEISAKRIKSRDMSID